MWRATSVPGPSDADMFNVAKQGTTEPDLWVRLYACSSTGTAADPDIGAYQGARLDEGPDDLHRGDEQPRVMKATWRESAGSASLDIAFSTAIQEPPSGTRMAVRLEGDRIVRSEPCRKVRQMALNCLFPTLPTLTPATATLLISRSVKSSGGKPVTLWAARPARVELAP